MPLDRVAQNKMPRAVQAIIVFVLMQMGVTNLYADDIPITINHRAGVVTPTGLLRLAKGDRVIFTITETDTQCYTYNATTKDPLSAAAAPRTDTITLVDNYDGRASSYRVVIAKQENAAATCTLPLIDRTFPVEVQGWGVSITGAVGVFDAVDPVFFLEPGSSTDAGGNTVQGYFVRRNESAEDDQAFGFSVLAHLYNSKHRLGNSDLQFAPISFGFGVSDNSEAEFLLGTSLKFGEALYLTVGKAWRRTKRLPSPLSLGDFTADANALSDLPDRSETGAFIAIGYRFGDIDLTKYNAPFAKQPTTQQN